MKEKKSVFKLILGTAICIVMLLGFAVKVPVYAAETEKELYLEEIIDLGSVETSVLPMGLFSLRDGNVTLIDGTAVKWIDRLALSEEEQVILDFYNSLVEWSDNDGVEDRFIADEYYVDKESYVTVATLDSEAGVTYDTQAAAATAADTEVDKYLKYIRAAVDAFDRDHPEVFWLTGSTQCGYYLTTWTDDSGRYVYSAEIIFYFKNSGFDVRAEEYQNASAITGKISAVEEKVAALTVAVADKSAVDKIKYFNKWLTENNQYNTSNNLNDIGQDCRKCTGALFGNIGDVGPVCEAYARAFKVLCDAEGIPCVLVDGNAGVGEDRGAHMWNYVQLGSRWYGVDVTWNDPTVANASGALSGYEREVYLLVGSDTDISGSKFIDSHPVSNTVSVGGVSFTKGPVLESVEFDGCDVHYYDGKGNCSVCGTKDDMGELAGYSLSLGGKIGVKFYMTLSSAVVSNPAAKMVFTLPGGSTEEVLISNAETDGEGRYIFTCEVAATEMDAVIKAQLVNGAQKGTEYSYTVKAYAEYILANSTQPEYAKAAEMVQTMLDYGACAKEYFGSGVSAPDVTEDFTTVAGQKGDLMNYKPVITGESDVFNYAGSTLILESEIKVRHYFKLTNESAIADMSGLTRYEAQNGDTVDGTYYYYESAGIAAADYGTKTTYAGVAGISVSYCPLSYVTTVVKNKDQGLADDTNLQNLMKALYLYYQATKAYNAN